MSLGAGLTESETTTSSPIFYLFSSKHKYFQIRDLFCRGVLNDFLDITVKLSIKVTIIPMKYIGKEYVWQHLRFAMNHDFRGKLKTF